MPNRIVYAHLVSPRADILAGCLGGMFGYFMHEKERPGEQAEKPLFSLLKRRFSKAE